MRPFENVGILDLTRVVSGPYCSHTLALMGAEVIKIEERGTGDATRNGIPELQQDGLASWWAPPRSASARSMKRKRPAGAGWPKTST